MNMRQNPLTFSLPSTGKSAKALIPEANGLVSEMHESVRCLNNKAKRSRRV